MTRLASGIWISAYLARARAANLPVYVVSKGDPVAGAIMVKCATLDGQAQAYQRMWDFETDTRPWREWLSGPEAEVDEAIRTERSRDPDLWVIEVESRGGRTLLWEEGLT